MVKTDAQRMLGNPDDGPVFPTPRKALAAYYAKRKGPGMARPRESRQESGEALSAYQWHTVGTILRDAGIEPGSEVDEAIRAWVLTSENATPLRRAIHWKVLEDLDKALRECGIVISKAKKREMVEARKAYQDLNTGKWHK